MVKKLFKHEFLSYARVMALVYGILLTVAVATKLIFIFESDTTVYQIISGFTALIFFVSVFAALGFSFVMGIIRFYRNLFTAEGYLSFTLPVTVEQHILVKAITAVAVNAVTAMMVALSCLITLSGEEFAYFWQELQLIWDGVYYLAGDHTVFFCIEMAILMLIGSFTSIMLYYTCISIGQMAKKNRVLAAVGVYFAYYILTQIVSTVFSVALSIFAASGGLEDVGYWITEYPCETIHIVMCSSIALSLVFLLVEFIINRAIMRKKLNLE